MFCRAGITTRPTDRYGQYSWLNQQIEIKFLRIFFKFIVVFVLLKRIGLITNVRRTGNK
jgi:hypothetical protein